MWAFGITFTTIFLAIVKLPAFESSVRESDSQIRRPAVCDAVQSYCLQSRTLPTKDRGAAATEIAEF